MNRTGAAHRVIAIDGPAASGKSSVARELARRLKFAYVNSGAMYRAVTWHVLEHDVDPANPAAVVASVERASIQCRLRDGESHIEIDGKDGEEHLRDYRVNAGVSLVSSVPRVREILVQKMRAFVEENDVVMEGRDIGSAVFPDTPFKFYIDASPEVRMKRRLAQGQRDEISARDQADSLRSASPLIIAPDAEVIDSSHVGIEGVVEEIVSRLKVKGLR